MRHVLQGPRPRSVASALSPKRRIGCLLGAVLLLLGAGLQPASPAAAAEGRLVHADVVALDHLLVYNRFGSFNPYGMIFALRRDVTAIVAEDPFVPEAGICGARLGTEAGSGNLAPGAVRLRDCKRPRPLVLRANVGDTLEVTVSNLLRPDQPDISGAKMPPSKAEEQPGPGFCEEPAHRGVAYGDDVRTAFDAQCRQARNGEKESEAANGFGTNWPLTRGLSFVLPGLEPLPLPGAAAVDPACLGTGAVAPGGRFTCRWRLGAEGTHLFSSYAAPAGGEADGGSLIQGLFGALIVEPAGAQAFRSQVTQAAFSAVWQKAGGGSAPRHARSEAIDYYAAAPDAAASGDGFDCGVPTVPVLAVLRRCADDGPQPRYEIVHPDLNAMIVPGGEAGDVGSLSDERKLRDWRVRKEAATPFREFTVIFHDELKTFYADDLQALGRYGQLEGIRDGFAINYGASGVGSAVLANRLKKGPAANCAECLYEEFFLESWANGDPALLEAFPDDPSNVHHSYLNDKVVFRNLHAGKETHVFHLHSHQWFAGNDAGRGAYLDSQTIGPQQGLTYRIYQGGLDRYAASAEGPDDTALPATPKGYWSPLGSGNRNRTPGDAIFHCHLYPHFAQGMWALWRVHDVLEDGSRLLPDGQKSPGLSTESLPETTLAEVEDPGYRTPRREGSVGRGGEWREVQEGTPIPGLVPLPEFGLPLLPTYAGTGTASDGTPLAGAPMPGYPFYVAGTAGHRAPQPPLDMANAADAGLPPEVAGALGRPRLDGGLPRHTVAAGRALSAAASDADRAAFRAGAEIEVPLARMLALGDMTSIFGRLRLELLPHDGTLLERAAMAFHHDGAGVRLLDAFGRKVDGQDPATGAYRVAAAPKLPPEPPAAPLAAPTGPGGAFPVNGAPAAPGAPFADPCGAPSVLAAIAPDRGAPYRRFDAHTGSWDGKAFLSLMKDPFRSAATGTMATDPGLIAFRRFQVSAVDVDLVVNRAGWHDPQGRINVLSENAGDLKLNNRTATAEPFYFRAFSGECIEFQHTNETKKALDLDDFQMKVPTDTIGQHIHLVKFDVTSSDGSGNGFNYEDGTFSPQEILERLCASAGLALKREGEDPATIDDPAARSTEQCAETFIERVAALPRLTAAHIGFFQTTVQRWFADPILSFEGKGETDPRSEVADRTLRTVFTHDHFGPSNIQQHGFYSALLIEPSTHIVCPLPKPGESTAIAGRCVPGPAASPPGGQPALAAREQEKHLVGSRANVFNYKDNPLEQDGSKRDEVSGDPLQVDAREYALAIADFALLYDGKGDPSPETPEALAAADPSSVQGLDRLVAEAVVASMDASPAEKTEKLRSPARDLAGGPGALQPTEERVTELAARRLAIRAGHGRPVAPPERPEAISAQHHDPYLVNYRNEPIPLRVGANRYGEKPPFAARPCGELPPPGSGTDHRRIVRQRTDGYGDMADVFRSGFHGDPCTPVIEGLSGDRIVVRLVQGAQEVQHVFTVEGRTMRRNVDQPFPSERHESVRAGPRGRAVACAESPFGRSGRPGQFPSWAVGAVASTDAYWTAMNAFVAGCENPLGFVAAQEIGISEHFEVGALFSAAVNSQVPALTGPAEAAQSTPRDLSATRPALDLLYHFGSTDALWNGAWGLIRTYDGPSAPDLSACLATPRDPTGFEACVDAGGDRPQIGRRLASFQALRAGWNDTPSEPAAGPPPPIPDTIPPETSELKAWCPLGAPRVPVIAAAVRAGDVLPKDDLAFPGTLYAEGPRRRALFDPDGLMLVPLSLHDLGLDGGAYDVGAFYSPTGGTGESLVDRFGSPAGPTLASKSSDDIRSIVRARLGAPDVSRSQAMGEPFVLRVEAGDCIDLLLVNAISATTPVWNQPGDAPMPDIVPLNVDRYQTGGSSAADFELVPSRRVALSIPLSVAMLKPGGLAPAGVNDAAAVPPGDGSAPFWSVTRYYAGFAWPSAADLAAALADDGPLEAKLAGLLASAAHPASTIKFTVPAFDDSACETASQLTVFGVAICADNASRDAVPAAQEALDAHFADPAEAQAVFHTTPYAFGTLPIRSLGDIVSHGVHGLSGTLVVEPSGAFPDAAADPTDPARFAWRHASKVLVEAPALALPASNHAEATTIPAARIREAVLLFQDGLNLWRIAPTVPAFFGWHGRPMPDCVVCDDSYDHGEKAVSYRSMPFRLRIAGFGGADAAIGTRGYPGRPDEDDLNAVEFPTNFLARDFQPRHMRGVETPTIDAGPGEEIAVRVAHPQGRARQRTFVASGFGYDDLFPGFGSGHAALVGPGKAITAFGCAPAVAGDTIWRDGPQHIFAAGVFGYLTVANDPAGPRATACPADGP